MATPIFRRLNEDWDAEPNAPCADVFAEGSVAHLTFFLNPWAYDAQEGDKGRLTFTHCAMWRLGATNDEGWHAGQCRYAKIAPAWGAFYELLGADEKRFQPLDWHEIAPPVATQRHFLFYLRDCTFECIADDWRFDRLV